MAQNITWLGASYSNVPAVELPKTGGGTATFYDDTGSQTYTENGTYDVTGLAEAVVNVAGGESATVATVTATPSSNATSLAFTVAGEPKAFAVMTGAQITLASTRYVMAVMSNGTTTYGVYGYKGSGGGSSAYCYYSASYFSFTYSNGTLTVKSSSSTNGGYFKSGTSYRLIYVY